MKHFTLLVIAAMLAFSAHGQVIFQNGFEDWTDNTPDGWMGNRTNLAAAPEQVTTDVQSGSSAVRLIREGAGHQRFTTQPMAVENGQAYTVSFWVRGQGDIRIGLYDDRSTGFGFFYNSYTNVTGNTWQQVTQQIVAANTLADAEFILSLHNTLGPEHLVVDEVTITAGEIVTPEYTSIYDIQYTTDPGGASPLAGQTVNTGGIVTAVTGDGFFIQNGGGPWSGIFVFSNQNVPARGDSVIFSATVTEYFGFTELEFVNNFVIVSNNHGLVESMISAADANTEAFESVLAMVVNATCNDVDAGIQQWQVNDGTANLRVDKILYNYTPTLGLNYNITGPIRYAFELYRIMPRDADDIDVSTGIGELAQAMVKLYPNPASDMLALELSGMNSRVEYQLVDATGRLVLSDVITSDRTMLNVGGLPNRIYALTLRTADNMWRTRVVVSR